MRIRRDWAVVVFAALLAAGVSCLKLWTSFPWAPDEGDSALSPGLDVIMQVYAETNTGWRGESVSTGVPIWIPAAGLIAVHLYLLIQLILRRQISITWPASVLGLILLVTVADFLVARSRGGEAGVGLAAAGFSCLLGLTVILWGLAQNKSPNKSEQDDAFQRPC